MIVRLKHVKRVRAKGRWYITEHGKMEDGTALLTLGVYHDEYTRGAEGWRFQRRRFDLLQLAGLEERLRGVFQRQVGIHAQRTAPLVSADRMHVDPGLDPVEHPRVAVPNAHRLHMRRVGAVLGLGDREGEAAPTCKHVGNPLRLVCPAVEQP